MNAAHDPAHAEVLAKLAVGDEAAVAAHVAAEVEGCPVCAPELAALRRVQAGLRDVAREERELLADARAQGSVPGLEEARAFARERVAEAKSARARRVVPRWLPALAAAVLVVLAAWMWTTSHHKRDDTPLGTPETIELLKPGEGYGHFEWRGSVGTNGWFEVEIFAPATDSSPRTPLLAHPQRVDSGHQWEPPASVRDAWPKKIEWRVRGFSATREPLGESAVGSAERSGS
jgi:hypothetical protein